jgi:phospholipase C
METFDRKDGSSPTSTPAETTADRVTRRKFLQRAGALGAAGFALPVLSKDWAFIRELGSPATPIEHVIISCQENRSFDHYFGYAPWIGSFGPPPGYTQPDGQGGGVAPYRFTDLTTPDVPHSWNAIHDQ